MSRKQQSYRNNGFRKLLTIFAALGINMYKSVFNRNQRNTGKAGGHLDTSYHSGGGSHSNTKASQGVAYKHKASIEKKRDRKQVNKSKRINRRRAAGNCSFKARA